METHQLVSTLPAAFTIRTPPYTPRLSTGRSIWKPACREGYDKSP